MDQEDDQSHHALTGVFEDYLMENHRSELLNILRAGETEKHYSIVINFMLLFENHVELGSAILSNASILLPLFGQRLIRTQNKLLQSIDEDDRSKLVVKNSVHVRISHLPSIPQINLAKFPLNRDVGNLVQICATVTRTTSPKMLEHRREYLCSKCKKIFPVNADYEMYYAIKPPTRCLDINCPGRNLAPVKTFNQLNYKDYQEIKIQEQVSRLGIGTVPRSMWATLEDDLVDVCKPGDDVKICGVVTRRWKSVTIGSRQDIDMYLRVNHLSVSNNEKMSVLITNETVAQFEKFWSDNQANMLLARDLIIASICPQIYGLYVVKLAVAIILAGGVCKEESSGCRLRGEPHLLLVGDPGLGKSHILKFASKISPRAVHTTGVGATSAGLTVTAVHEQGEWQLEAGALVLADGGICCIDEFSAIREHDRTTIHEAMEQQTISVAKAGVVCKLNTRCKILAATNPKGNYDPNIPLSVNIGIASPLLSRFDLVLVLLDSKNALWDKTVSDFILCGKTAYKTNSKTSLWNAEKLLEYFSVIKTLNPKLTADANNILSAYYQSQRGSDSRNAARTTVRLLESLIRLSQGHARLMFRENVLVQDAIVAISLVESSMMGTMFLSNVDTLHDTFPVNPTMEYKKQAEAILGALGLHHILREEKKNYEGIVGDSNSQTRVSAAHNLSEKSEVLKGAAERNENLNAIISNMRKNKEKNMLDSLLRKPPPQVKRNKTKKSGNQKRSVGKTSKIKAIVGPSTFSADEDDPSEPTDPAIHGKRDDSNEDDLGNIFHLSSDSEVETLNVPVAKVCQKTSRSSKNTPKKRNHRVSTVSKNSSVTNLQNMTKRKRKSLVLESSGDSSGLEGGDASKNRSCVISDGAETTRNIAEERQPVLADNEKVETIQSEDECAELPLFSEFRARRRREAERKRSAPTPIRDKLLKFAHTPRESEPQTVTNEHDLRSNESVDASFLLDQDMPSCTHRNESESIGASQKSLFPSQVTPASTNLVFSMFNATNDEDLNVLDDL